MKIFILGRSQSGKTTLAKELCQALDLQHVAASQWVRSQFAASHLDKQTLIEEMTRFAVDALRQNPYTCLEYLNAQYHLHQPSVLEGIRNPFDFIHLFNPTKDLIIWMNYSKNAFTLTTFETGLEVIASYISWLLANTLLMPERILHLNFEKFDSNLMTALEHVRRFQ